MRWRRVARRPGPPGAGGARWLWPILAFQALLLVLNARYHFFNPDEIEGVHTAWKMGRGEIIYRDFFQHHHPLFYQLLVPVVRLAGDDPQVLIWLRGGMAALALGLAGATYALARAVGATRLEALLAPMLALPATGFADKAFEIRPDVPMALCGVGAAALLWRAARGGGPWYAAAAGLCLGLALAFLQKAIFLAALLAALALWLAATRRLTPRALLAFALAFALALAAFLAWIVPLAGWEAYWRCNWRLNQAALFGLFPAKGAYTYKDDALLWFLFVAGCVSLPRAWAWRALALVAGGLLASVYLVGVHHKQYLLPVTPFAAVLAARALAAGSARLGVRRLALALAIAVPLLSLPQLKSVGSRHHAGFAQRQWHRITYVLAVAPADEPVYDGGNLFNLFRPDVDYAWFSVHPDNGLLPAYQALTGYRYDPYARVLAARPKVISAFALRPWDPRLRPLYRRSLVVPSLWIRRD